MNYFRVIWPLLSSFLPFQFNYPYHNLFALCNIIKARGSQCFGKCWQPLILVVMCLLTPFSSSLFLSFFFSNGWASGGTTGRADPRHFVILEKPTPVTRSSPEKFIYQNLFNVRSVGQEGDITLSSSERSTGLSKRLSVARAARYLLFYICI